MIQYIKKLVFAAIETQATTSFALQWDWSNNQIPSLLQKYWMIGPFSSHKIQDHQELATTDKRFNNWIIKTAVHTKRWLVYYNNIYGILQLSQNITDERITLTKDLKDSTYSIGISNATIYGLWIWFLIAFKLLESLSWVSEWLWVSTPFLLLLVWALLSYITTSLIKIYYNKRYLSLDNTAFEELFDIQWSNEIEIRRFLHPRMMEIFTKWCTAIIAHNHTAPTNYTIVIDEDIVLVRCTYLLNQYDNQHTVSNTLQTTHILFDEIMTFTK